MTITFPRTQPKSIMLLPARWSRRLILAAAFCPSLILGQTTYTPYTFTTLAGLAGIGGTDGTAGTAHFNRAAAVAVDSQGNPMSRTRKTAPSGRSTRPGWSRPLRE